MRVLNFTLGVQGGMMSYHQATFVSFTDCLKEAMSVPHFRYSVVPELSERDMKISVPSTKQ